VRIIGIDPGTAICGYGIIDVKGSKLTPVAYGAITTPKELTDSQRLEILFNDLSDLLDLKVEIKTASNGKKGKLILDFKNEKELEDILTYFNQSF